MQVTIAGFAGYKVPISTGILIRILQLLAVKGCDFFFFDIWEYFVMDLRRTEQKVFIQQTEKWNIDQRTSDSQRHLKEEAAVRFGILPQ